MAAIIELVHSKSGKTLTKLSNLTGSSSIQDVKKEYQKIKPALYPSRQAYRTEPRGRMLKDEDTLTGLQLKPGSKLFFKDLGPQIGWKTVFLTEYAGPLLCYLALYPRPAFIYGEAAASEPTAPVVKLACICWTAHYGKRLLETAFVHRFSHGTMPLSNIFKNSSYYWGFTIFVSYFINHPLYTPPIYGDVQIYTGLAGFIFCELGNLSIHLALRDLRPPGTKVRRIPKANSNPFTWLFNAVSCPNYTYEVGAWLSFSVMTQSLPALVFTVVGFAQMTVWAWGKHRNYKKEFKDYPRSRKPIIPFFL